jgi:hypothetical protein
MEPQSGLHLSLGVWWGVIGARCFFLYYIDTANVTLALSVQRYSAQARAVAKTIRTPTKAFNMFSRVTKKVLVYSKYYRKSKTHLKEVRLVDLHLFQIIDLFLILLDFSLDFNFEFSKILRIRDTRCLH